MSTQRSILCRVPVEILVEIALEVVLLDTRLGPPTELMPLLITCKEIYDSLRFANCGQLYARIFRGKFDHRAAGRRLGRDATMVPHLANQLKKYSLALKRIRGGDLYSDDLEADFWTVYLMCLENDGKNEAHLQWAGLDTMLDQFIRTHLWEFREDYNNWPEESTINSLAVWLYWHRLNRAKVAAMTAGELNQLLDLIRPYAITALRYPCFFAPDNHFNLPLPGDMRNAAAHTIETPHGFYPQYRQPVHSINTIEHYGRNIDICTPLIGQGAKLLYMTLEETPLPMFPNLPRDRQHAFQLGFTDIRLTRVDVMEANALRSVKLNEPGDWDWRSKLSAEQGKLEDDPTRRVGLRAKSALYDDTWSRLTYCGNPWLANSSKSLLYTPGSLTGLWKGRGLEPDVDQYFGLVMSTTFPADFSDQNPRLMTATVWMNLREHHCIMPGRPIGAGGSNNQNDDGINDAWFPKVHFQPEARGRIRVRDEDTRAEYEYETFVPGRKNSHRQDTCTACIRRREEAEAEFQDRGRMNASVDGSSSSSSQDAEVQQARNDVNKALGPDGDVDGLLENALAEASQDKTGTGGATRESTDEHVKDTCSGICDIIVTGETLPRHGEAWEHYKFYGRVRAWDGLIAIVRRPVDDSYLGTYVFRGYLVAGNFVGSWRLVVNNMGAFPIEGPFAMSKV